MIGAFLLCRLLLAELEKKKFVNPLIVYAARILRCEAQPNRNVFASLLFLSIFFLPSSFKFQIDPGLRHSHCYILHLVLQN